MRRVLLACLLSCSLAVAAGAQAQDAGTDIPDVPVSAADAARAHDLALVVVRGVQPGPRLWKVTKGDHVLWILGTLSPLPKRMTWDSRRTEGLVASAQEVVTAPEVSLKSNAGFFATVAVLPSLIGLRDNPDGRKLRDVVPAELYQRWSPLKEKYIGGSRKVEGWRPLFAAIALYDAAIGKIGLSADSTIQKTVVKAAKRAKVKVTTPMVEVTVDKPRAAVKEFKKAGLDDLDCFRKTLDRIDADLGTMTARANAWSTGDVGTLRRLPFSDQMATCAAAVSRLQLEQTHGVGELDVRARKAWLDAVTGALDRNAVSFAMLPIARLLKSDGGYVARFRELGYTVEEPASTAPAEPAAAAMP